MAEGESASPRARHYPLSPLILDTIIMMIALCDACFQNCLQRCLLNLQTFGLDDVVLAQDVRAP